MRKRASLAQFYTRMPWPYEFQHTVIFTACQAQIKPCFGSGRSDSRPWHLFCWRVGSRGRTRGPGLVMIHWIILVTVLFLELLLILMSTLFLFSEQIKSFLTPRPAYHAEVHTVDMVLATLRMKPRLGYPSKAMSNQENCPTGNRFILKKFSLYASPCTTCRN